MKCCKGFSLVELMIVVSIIAILSLVAIPSYKGYQARARQKEGFALGNAYYVAAQSTRAEFGHYPGNFVQTGFRPTGRLTHRLRVFDGKDVDLGATFNDNECQGTQHDCNCAGNCPDFKTWEEDYGAPKVKIGAYGCDWSAPCGPPAMGDDTFQALMCGVVNLSANSRDQYAINHRKEVTMCLDGLH